MCRGPATQVNGLAHDTTPPPRRPESMARGPGPTPEFGTTGMEFGGEVRAGRDARKDVGVERANR